MTETPATRGPVTGAPSSPGDRARTAAQHAPAEAPARRTVGLVVNPTAGHGRGGEAGRRTAELLARAGVDVVDLTGASVADAVARARPAALDGLAALVVVGGDGMVHLGVNATVGTPTPLAIVAAGSGNDYAHVLGLPVHDVEASVRQVVAALDHPPRRVDAVHVGPHVPGTTSGARAAAGTAAGTATAPPGLAPDTEGGWGGRWYAGVLSLGLDADVNARANTYRWPAGHGRYVRAVLACLAGFTPYGYTLTTDDGTRTFRGTLVAVASSSQFGGGLSIAPDAQVDDGHLDVVYATELSRRGILRLFPRLYRGTHLSHPAVHVLRTRSVVVTASGDGRVPPVAFADGEVVGPVPLRVEVYPGALHVLAGPAQPARTAGVTGSL
ncbi:sphingosine/diacylglycerol kinase-like enzyme [Sanguibacter keddieii DSM 10542]|uniref:Sphingosine/diacylglycerol kinase-like enzyme n=1 Tax=Sanguibacter keddieii (strain ATCC 51767 / DSM 10542 / NCFB 3025 / ST-74) TaxID=446469 RepID=D1BH57_SANKS|nr:diacylglycerol kinase family protein [Sanguibacter keddieii]ACZ21777.1 sphingosine/diacylglycerol kinase-like enzyme [Sanguibacter keddieii DSM 10542]